MATKTVTRAKPLPAAEDLEEKILTLLRRGDRAIHQADIAFAVDVDIHLTALALVSLAQRGLVTQGKDFGWNAVEPPGEDQIAPPAAAEESPAVKDARDFILRALARSPKPLPYSLLSVRSGAPPSIAALAIIHMKLEGVITELPDYHYMLAELADQHSPTELPAPSETGQEPKDTVQGDQWEPETFPSHPSQIEPGEKPAPSPTYRADIKTGEIIEIALHRIRPNPDNPRKHFDEEAISELAENIRQNGLLHPVTVIRKDDPKLGPGAQYQLVCGGSRYRAYHNLHAEYAPAYSSIWAMVVQATPAQAAEMALAENVARRDINPIEQARAIKRVMDLHAADPDSEPVSQREIALRVGLSQPAIANALRLTELVNDVQEWIQDRKLTASHGLGILRQLEKWPAAQSRLGDYIIRADSQGRHIPASRLEGDLYDVAKLIVGDGGPAYIPSAAMACGILEVCKKCPFDSFVPALNNWESPICMRPDHLAQVMTEYEAAAEARAAEATAKLRAQLAAPPAPIAESAAAAPAAEWPEAESMMVRGTGFAPITIPAAADSTNPAPPTPTETLPQLDDLPRGTHRLLLQDYGCGADCPCFAHALNGTQIVDICTDPERFDARQKAKDRAEKKNQKHALEAAKIACAENIRRGDHPEVIRRAAVLVVAPSHPGQLQNDRRREVAASIGVELPTWDGPDRHQMTGYQQIEKMCDAFAAMETADLIRLAALGVIEEDLKNVERGYTSRPVFAAWFGRPLPEVPPVAAGESNDPGLSVVIGERDSLRERLAGADARIGDLRQEILKLKGVIRRQETVDRSDIIEHDEIKEQRDKLQVENGKLKIANRAEEAENASLRLQIVARDAQIARLTGQPEAGATKGGKQRVNAAKDPELQAVINRQHAEITQLKTSLLFQQGETKRLREEIKHSWWVLGLVDGVDPFPRVKCATCSNIIPGGRELCWICDPTWPTCAICDDEPVELVGGVLRKICRNCRSEFGGPAAEGKARPVATPDPDVPADTPTPDPTPALCLNCGVKPARGTGRIGPAGRGSYCSDECEPPRDRRREMREEEITASELDKYGRDRGTTAFAVGQRVRVLKGAWSGSGAVIAQLTDGGNYRVRPDLPDGRPASVKSRAVFMLAATGESPAFKMGDIVRVVCGKHKGREGKIVLSTGATVYVELEAPADAPFRAERVPCSAIELVAETAGSVPE